MSLTSQARNPALVTAKAIGIEKAIVESSNTFIGYKHRLCSVTKTVQSVQARRGRVLPAPSAVGHLQQHGSVVCMYVCMYVCVCIYCRAR